MDKHFIDYSSLEKDLNRPKHYKYADVKDKLVKVAFDIVKFNDPNEDIDGLWQIKATDDGEVIVALYEPAENVKQSNTDSSGLLKNASFGWQVIAGKDSLNLFYKEEPIARYSFDQFGIEKDDRAEFCKHVNEKLNTDTNYVKALFNELPIAKKAEIAKRFPELTK
jgi:uncharacterized protein YllA (UPF0747 family)